jgi:hypothetical protein
LLCNAFGVKTPRNPRGLLRTFSAHKQQEQQETAGTAFPRFFRSLCYLLVKIACKENDEILARSAC